MEKPNQSYHAYSRFFGVRIEDFMVKADTPIWDAMVAEHGDPIPHIPAWPGIPEEAARAATTTGSTTDPRPDDDAVVADTQPAPGGSPPGGTPGD